MIDWSRYPGNLDWATHLPLLMACVSVTSGPVLEVGAGRCSTPVLHAVCRAQQRRLVTVEGDPWCFDHLQRHYADQGHEFRRGYECLPELAGQAWAVVFSDESPGSRRAETVRLFLDVADFIVIHDIQSPEIFPPIAPLIAACWSRRDADYPVETLAVSKHRSLRS
jgi:hypothetical protein